MYLDLTTYNEIYQELVYQRNEIINWFDEYKLISRDRFVKEDNQEEISRHKMALPFRQSFRRTIPKILDRLYSHDAIEAIYDFNSAELGNWSDTEANWLERELQRLQVIISKLEVRYDLQYRLVFEYRSEECTLYLNNIKVFACGQLTLRNRLMSVLFSNLKKRWSNQDIEDYFIDNFSYYAGDLKDTAIEKAGNDIKKDVASRTGIRDFLLVSNSSITINSAYL